LNKSLFSLTASREREQSFESADLGGGHAAFFQYLCCQGMEGKPITSRDGVVSADGLAEYWHNGSAAGNRNTADPTSDRGKATTSDDAFRTCLRTRLPPRRPRQTGGLVFESNMTRWSFFIGWQVSFGVLSK